jgi:uncharacterized membrane protein (UPF0127 family)
MAASSIRISNQTRDTTLASRAWAARTFWSRGVGLLGRKSLEEGEGLLIEPCKSVHTAFMRFPIDVIYIDKEHRVVKLVPSMRAFRASAALKASHAVLELPVGAIGRSQTAVGDQLAIIE